LGILSIFIHFCAALFLFSTYNTLLTALKLRAILVVFDTHNPATGQVSKQMESTSANDTAKAIAVASEKFGIQTQ